MGRDTRAVDQLFRDAVANEVLPGVVAAVASHNETLYANAFGVRDQSTGAPMLFDSVHGIMSMTKLPTAIVLLQLVEQGLVELRTPVGDVVPAFDELPVLWGFDGSTPVLRAATRRGTILNLLTNTSGASNPDWSAKLARYAEVSGVPSLGTGSRRAFELPLVCEPGTAFNYGMSMDWLGLVIEALTGRPYEVVLYEKVLEPLGLYDTVVERSPDQVARTACVHARGPDGHWEAVGAEYYASGTTKPEVYPAGWCLYSTAADFLRLQVAMLGDGACADVRLLQAATVNDLFRNQIGRLDVGIMRASFPWASCDVPLAGWKWGLGIMVNIEARPKGRSAGSGGWAGGWNTFFWVDRARGLTAAMYTQTVPFYEAGIVSCFTDFETLVSAWA